MLQSNLQAKQIFVCEKQSSVTIVPGHPECGQLFPGKDHSVTRDRSSLGEQLLCIQTTLKANRNYLHKFTFKSLSKNVACDLNKAKAVVDSVEGSVVDSTPAWSVNGKSKECLPYSASLYLLVQFY